MSLDKGPAIFTINPGAFLTLAKKEKSDVRPLGKEWNHSSIPTLPLLQLKKNLFLGPCSTEYISELRTERRIYIFNFHPLGNSLKLGESLRALDGSNPGGFSCSAPRSLSSPIPLALKFKTSFYCLK